MRTVLFYTWCIGGLILTALGIRYAMRTMSPDMAIGVGIGIGFAIFLFALNERLDIVQGRRDLAGRWRRQR